MLEYKVSARRIDSHGSAAIAKDAEITLDTDMAGDGTDSPASFRAFVSLSFMPCGWPFGFRVSRSAFSHF